MHLFTGDNDYAPLFDGSPTTVASIGDADVLSHAIGGGRDIRRPGPDARPSAPTGDAEARLCTGVSSQSSSFAICGRRNEDLVTPHWREDGEAAPTRKFLELAWHETGAAGGLWFAEPLDLTTDRLELRTIVDPAYDDPDVQVRISDSAGGSALLDPVPGTEPTALPEISWATKLWGTAVVVDASGASGVDLTDITQGRARRRHRRGPGVDRRPGCRARAAGSRAVAAAAPGADRRRERRRGIGRHSRWPTSRGRSPAT